MIARSRAVAGLVLAFALAARAPGAEPADLRRDLQAGRYERVIEAAQAELRAHPGEGECSLVLVQALLAVGRYGEARSATSEALERDPASIRLRWLARRVDLANGRTDEAAARPNEIRRMVASRPWDYRTAEDIVVFGRVALLLGADPKDVLDKVYAPAQSADPKARDVYLARGELALDKHDFALAAKAFEEGLAQLPDDPDLLCGRARAYAAGERETALEALRAALRVNPRHVPSLLQLADHQVDAEAYEDAGQTLARALAVNPAEPDAWAYRAVIAHLRNDRSAEAGARQAALEHWPTNPRVDYLMGRKLAQKYRFAEAAVCQRRALGLDPNYLPASAELAVDLLRLGEGEGWTIARDVHNRDDYDVEAYNLVTLHDTMAKYATLAADDFVVRMAAPEVAIYGPRVLGLLRRARQVLASKYGAELASPTYVEIFADQKDFAVRTFGLPDVAGFLGVCFGRVVTANSPAAADAPVNWESVLWHEFCHVVTLQMTKNRMPRWLSEGISVYEERQANPAWGMRLNPRYREMLLAGDRPRVGELSGAFLAPKTPEHLQFAYVQSSLVVEYIVGHYGLERLRGVLRDLAEGADINAALAKNVAPLSEIEAGFDAFARRQADDMAPGLGWEKPDPEILAPGAERELAAWAADHPDNYWLLKLRAAQATDEENWAEARKPLTRLIELYPRQKGADSAYRPLVAALRAIGDAPAERAVLTRWAAVDDEATDAYLRLMELAAADQDWATVKLNAERCLAVNPLVAPPYRHLAQACAATGDVSGAVVAWRTLLQLQPPDPAEAHFQLARLLRSRGENREAKREVLLAIEETPRFRAALRLLTQLQLSDDPVVAPAGIPDVVPAGASGPKS